MTMPAPETLEREKDKLYLTDAEMIRRIGVPDKTLRSILPALETKYGFPPKSAFFPGRRFWPAVEAWLYKHNGLTVDPSATTRRGIR